MMPSDALLARAAELIVQLDSGRASAADREACAAWRAQSAQHEQAWLAVERSLSCCSRSLKTLSSAPGHGRLVQDVLAASPRRSRRALLAAVLAVGAGAAGGGALLDRRQPLGGLLADYATGTGQRATHTLADGSALMLDARSSADFHIDAAVRQLSLRQGQALVWPARAAVPFHAATPHCTVIAAAAADGAFMLRRAARGTLAVALQMPLTLSIPGRDAWPLATGQGCWVDHAGMRMLEPAEAVAQASWRHGRLEVLDESLGQVVQALRAYYEGIIRLQSEAAALRIQGVLPLDNVDAALDTLAQTRPLRITQWGGWYVRIDLAA